MFFRASAVTRRWLAALLRWAYDRPYEHDQKALSAFLGAGVGWCPTTRALGGRDAAWLEDTLKETAASDEFTRKLLELRRQTDAKGLKQTCSLG